MNRHILPILLTALATLGSGLPGTRVLCIGADGHIAIERPHADGHGDHESGDLGIDLERGACDDLVLAGVLTLRPERSGASLKPDVQLWLPPVVHVDLLAVSLGLPSLSHPPETTGCSFAGLASTVLLV